MNFLFLLVLSIFFHKTYCIRPSIAYGKSLKVNGNDESNTKDSEPWTWYDDIENLFNERTKEDIILNKMDEKEHEDLVFDIAKEAILIIEDMFDESNTKDSEPRTWYDDIENLFNERTKEDIILSKMDEKERKDLVLHIAKEAILIIEDMFDKETPITKTEISVSIHHKNKDVIVLAIGCFFVISALVLLIKFNTKEKKVVPKDLQKKALQI